MAIKGQWHGRCINSTSDLGSIYTFVFSPTPYKPARSNCYYCVRFFARTVNIIEKIESKYIIKNRCVSVSFPFEIYVTLIINQFLSQPVVFRTSIIFHPLKKSAKIWTKNNSLSHYLLKIILLSIVDHPLKEYFILITRYITIHNI